SEPTAAMESSAAGPRAGVPRAGSAIGLLMESGSSTRGPRAGSAIGSLMESGSSAPGPRAGSAIGSLTVLGPGAPRAAVGRGSRGPRLRRFWCAGAGLGSWLAILLAMVSFLPVIPAHAGGGAGTREALVVFSAGALRPPLESLATLFEKDT